MQRPAHGAVSGALALQGSGTGCPAAVSVSPATELLEMMPTAGGGSDVPGVGDSLPVVSSMFPPPEQLLLFVFFRSVLQGRSIQGYQSAIKVVLQGFADGHSGCSCHAHPAG